jgi:hypothetical protein
MPISIVARYFLGSFLFFKPAGRFSAVKLRRYFFAKSCLHFQPRYLERATRLRDRVIDFDDSFTGWVAAIFYRERPLAVLRDLTKRVNLFLGDTHYEK